MSSATITTTTTTSAPSSYRILIEFAFKHVDFQLAELESVLECNGFRGTIQELPNHSNGRPYVVFDLLLGDNNNAVDQSSSIIGSVLVSQCTLVRSVMELWGVGETLDLCVASTREFATQHFSVYRPLVQDDCKSSWKLTVHSYGSTLNCEEQDRVRKQFSFLGFKGPVRMKDPDMEFVYLQEVKLLPVVDSFDSSSTSTAAADAASDACDAATPGKQQLVACYFGRTLSGPRRTKGRAGLEQYTLKKRSYLGPTSMDAELSMIMASLAKVTKGSIVFDPFVGTGSILVACALRGAYCVGADIDIRVLRGRSETENVLSNFRQFGLPRPELIRSDNAIYHRHYRHLNHVPLYDAIVCDPPYGIRAGARRCGSKLDQPRPVPDERRHDHIAQTRPYPVSDVMADLLDVAARTLAMGGRLVYIIPSFSDFDPDSDLPRHACLTLVHSCFQPLNGELGRRVVAMEKVLDYDPSQRDCYLQTTWKNGPESAEKCANIREKILEAAKKKPYYQERLAVRRQNRKRIREEKKQAKTSSQSDEVHSSSSSSSRTG